MNAQLPNRLANHYSDPFPHYVDNACRVVFSVHPTSPKEAKPSPDWRKELRSALGVADDQLAFTLLHEQIAELDRRISSVAIGAVQIVVVVQSFAPEPYEAKPFSVTVRHTDDEFVAYFSDANLTSYGDNEFEAVDNLKLLILDTYDGLSAPGVKLGPVPRKQLAVLREFVKPKA